MHKTVRRRLAEQEYDPAENAPNAMDGTTSVRLERLTCDLPGFRDRILRRSRTNSNRHPVEWRNRGSPLKKCDSQRLSQPAYAVPAEVLTLLQAPDPRSLPQPQRTSISGCHIPRRTVLCRSSNGNVALRIWVISFQEESKHEHDGRQQRQNPEGVNEGQSVRLPVHLPVEEGDGVAASVRT